LLLLRARIKYNFAKKGGKCLRTNVNPARSQQRKREKRREKKKVKEAKGGQARWGKSRGCARAAAALCHSVMLAHGRKNDLHAVVRFALLSSDLADFKMFAASSRDISVGHPAAWQFILPILRRKLSSFFRFPS
jgi:hypothetical protein